MKVSELARKLYDRVNQRDFGAVREMSHEGSEWRDIAREARVEGPDGLQRLLQPWLAAFSDLQFQTLRIIESTAETPATSGTAVAELVMTGTHMGPFPTAAGMVWRTGRRVTVPACAVLRIENGQILELRHYCDLLTLLDQLGVAGLFSAEMAAA